MKAWETFLDEQEKELGQVTVKKWLRSLRVVKFDAQNLYLEAKDSFQALWFEEHIRKKLDLSFRNNNYSKIKVHLAIGNALEAVRSRTKREAKHKGSKNETGDGSARFTLTFDSINPHCTFEKFYVSEAHQITHQILNEPSTFNPIYLWGPSGTGKTHLLMAMTCKLGQAGLKVTYARTETY